MFESLKLPDLPVNNCCILRHPTSTRPTIWVVEEDGKRAIVKDFSANSLLYRHVAGRFLVWRESRAYQKLQGLKGIPRIYRIIDGIAIIVEEIPGRNLDSLGEKIKLTGDFFDDLRTLVDSFHERGIVHCDLKRAPNVIRGYDGLPYIVDWASSISGWEARVFPLNLLYRRFVIDDNNAIIKLKISHLPESVTQEERDRLYHRSTAEKVTRFIRDKLRALLQRLA